MERTPTDVFLNPHPNEVEAVERERAAGLEELELAASGLLSLGGEQPDSQALPADGALRGEYPLSSTSGSEVHNG